MTRVLQFHVVAVLLLLFLSFANGQQCGSQVGGTTCTALGFPLLCCSSHGWCGDSAAHCGAGCQNGPCDNAPATDDPNSTTAPSQDSRNCVLGYDMTRAEMDAMLGGTLRCTTAYQRGDGTQHAASDCQDYYLEIKRVMAVYQINCPHRIASFLSQIRHETDILRTFYQPADGGAGAIHMIPANFPLACNGIPSLATAIQNELGLACASAAVNSVGLIIQRTEFAFETAGWWYASGANVVLGHLGCQDLRPYADDGYGTSTGCTVNQSSGNLKVSYCIFGNRCDSSQRNAYYNTARVVSDAMTDGSGSTNPPATAAYTAPPATNPPATVPYTQRWTSPTCSLCQDRVATQLTEAENLANTLAALLLAL